MMARRWTAADAEHFVSDENRFSHIRGDALQA
jgi:hypothetical protein